MGSMLMLRKREMKEILGRVGRMTVAKHAFSKLARRLLMSRFVYMCNEHTPQEDFRKPESGRISPIRSNFYHCHRS